MGHYVTTEGGPVHVVDHGGEGRILLLVHGLGGSHLNWMAVAPRLAKGHHVFSLDMPGFGVTPPHSDYRLSTHAAAVAGVATEIPAPLTLIGNSMGGLVSMRVAAYQPHLVDRLVLVSPATAPVLVDPRRHNPTALRLLAQATPGLGGVVGKYLRWRNTPEQQVRMALEFVTHDPARIPLDLWEATVDLARMRRKLPWSTEAVAESANAILRAFLSWKRVAGVIGSIRCPTLVIHGSADRIVSPTSIRRLVASRRDWTHLELDDTGHTPHMDAPVRFSAAVREWLAEAPLPAAGTTAAAH